MSMLINRILDRYKNRFEASGDESTRDTFYGELNYVSGKIFFVIFITLVIMLLYIPNDLASHQFPYLAVSIHLGYTLLSAILIALRFTKRFRYSPNILMMIFVMYLYIGTSLLAAASGPTIYLYIAPFSVVLMIPVFAPFPLRFKISGTVIAILIFFLVAPVSGINFSDPSIYYITTDLVVAAILSILLSLGQNRMRYNAWEQRNQFKHALKEVEQHDMFIKTMNRISEILLMSDIDSLEQDLLDSMSIIANSVHADHIFIWKNFRIDGELYVKMVYDWPEETGTLRDSVFSSALSYADSIPEWEEKLSQGYFINGIVRELSSHEQALLSPLGVLSVLLVPLFIQDRFWGFAGFDNCRSERLFSLDEISVLNSSSLLIVTALIRNETALDIRATASRLEAVISNHPGIIFCVDENDSIILFNGNYLKQMGPDFYPERFIGKSLDVVKNSPFHADIIEKIGRTFTNGPQEWVSEMLNGVFHARTTPIYDSYGKVTNVVGSIDDISKVAQLQKDLEQALKMANEASRVKSEFLAKMSHEIRTPMNAIIGMTELALRSDKPESTREHILTVKQASANLLTIINDILDFSKIETGKMEIIPGDYSFASLINDVVSIIRMRVIDSQIRFAVNIDSGIPNALYGDEIRIRQGLLNMLSNAVKYTEKGFVSLTAYGEITDDDTVILTMEVMDSGRGIKPNDIKNLFGDYAQFDVEKNRGIEGVGLGLAITKSIVKAMDGDISVQSEYGIGSTFTVTLPQKIRLKDVLAVVEDPEEKSVIVYERREIYANSIVFAVDNLGVTCTLVSNDEELSGEMSRKEYEFVFISFTLFKKNKNTIMKYGGKAKIVVLTEFGEAIPDISLNVLAMPVHSISIADILNGVSNNFSYNENNELIVRFTAPEARVLVVDDISTNLKVAEGLLLPYMMKVDICKSGLEAIEAVKGGGYDLIFMDHKMPEMDGIEATLLIRGLGEKEPYYRNIPIIALTANAVSGTREMFLMNGFNDFLSKPINTVKLNSILEKWIPKEKKKTTVGESAAEITMSPKEAGQAIEITGIDTERGMALSGGMKEQYIESLSLFSRDTAEKLKEIEECLENNDLPLYTIHVHGLKSAAANIGANELSEAAKALEAAGNRSDMAYIKKNNNKFIKNMLEQTQKIETAVTEYKSGRKEEAEPLDREFMRGELIKLKAALGELDAGITNEIIENLRKFTQGEDIDSVIQSISDNILIAEYDEAIAIIDRVLQEGKLV